MKPTIYPRPIQLQLSEKLSQRGHWGLGKQQNYKACKEQALKKCPELADQFKAGNVPSDGKW